MRKVLLCMVAVTGMLGAFATLEVSAYGAAVPSVLTCAGTVVIRPSTYVLSCADANTYFTSIHWTSWTSTSATATATFVENNCEPTCAAGKFLRYPARLVLSQPKSTTKHGILFSTMKYNYTVSSSWDLPLKTLAESHG